MPNTPHAAVTKPDTTELPADLKQLVTAVDALPPHLKVELAPILDRVTESTLRRRRILSLVQDALSQLRLDMKYLMFDLEATRRERDDYRARLEGEIEDTEE
ncbi:MAG: transcriptional regulator [Planctomycetota bacterium]